MIITAYALFDAKVGVYHQPFFMLHRGQAIRATMELGSDLNTTVGRYPADFHLYEIGLYDDSTGTLSALPAPVALGPVASFLEPSRAQLPLFGRTGPDGQAESLVRQSPPAEV